MCKVTIRTNMDISRCSGRMQTVVKHPWYKKEHQRASYRSVY